MAYFWLNVSETQSYTIFLVKSKNYKIKKAPLEGPDMA
jgi:hypothetical protein